MKRYLGTGLSVLLCLVSAWGQGAQAPVTRLTIGPSAAPVPALKYRLLPETRDLTSGNAALRYYRTMASEWTLSYYYRQPQFVKLLNKWLENPQVPPPPEVLRQALSPRMRELELGAHRTYCDWEFIERLRQDGALMLLPDVQDFSSQGTFLSIRARLQIRDRQFDKAARTLQTGFALGRDVANAPIIINALVGRAIASQMIGPLEEWIQTPGSPNLYWALANLPTSVIDLRRPLEGEKIILDHLLPGFREMLQQPEIPPLSEQQLQEHIHRIKNYIWIVGRPPGVETDWETQLRLTLWTARLYPEARKFLIAQGRSAAQVDKLPRLQTVLLYEVYHYDRLYDEVLKWLSFPYPQARRGLEEARRLEQEHLEQTESFGISLIHLPASDRVLISTVSLSRQLAALRCIEALRLYAATHRRLPATLRDIQEVPVPEDPATGRDFTYHSTGNRATLYGPSLPPYSSLYLSTINYELILKLD